MLAECQDRGVPKIASDKAHGAGLNHKENCPRGFGALGCLSPFFGAMLEAQAQASGTANMKSIKHRYEELPGGPRGRTASFCLCQNRNPNPRVGSLEIPFVLVLRREDEPTSLCVNVEVNWCLGPRGGGFRHENV